MIAATTRTESSETHRESVDALVRKTVETVAEANRIPFYPVRVYGYICMGIMFANTFPGRGTTVVCVVDTSDKYKLLALKMAWQDAAVVARQELVTEKLMCNKPHSNIIIPVKSFKQKRNGKIYTTLGGIRGFLDDQVERLAAEDRVLTVSISELKRPVKYFWGVHDFVRGLRGALLGHEHLTNIGILHRDISENNIVLGRRPGDERGYLIDLDMAILQEPSEPTPDRPTSPELDREYYDYGLSSITNKKNVIMGTQPYISSNVLLGGNHTQFDDVESFLYVLLLFFFSYAGPLSAMELREADENGFVELIRSEKLPHLRNWPKRYATWIDGNPEVIGCVKFAMVMLGKGATQFLSSVEFVRCLENQWPDELHDPIRDLIRSSFRIFWESGILKSCRLKSRTEVSHATFIETLEKWLDRYSDLEDRFSNCPFKDVVHVPSS